MKKLLQLSLLCAGLQGCATHRELTLAHNVNVPEKFRAGNFSEEHPNYMEGNSAVERYVNSYERGWIDCVARYASDIDLEDTGMYGGGWPEEEAGYNAGYYAARKRILSLIQTYGKKKVFDYLNQFRPMFPAK